jgi:hypothetical protein
MATCLKHSGGAASTPHPGFQQLEVNLPADFAAGIDIGLRQALEMWTVGPVLGLDSHTLDGSNSRIIVVGGLLTT